VILRDKGLLYIHIPKTAGTTVDRHLYGSKLYDVDTPNYEIGWGWCPERKVWMQHLTLQELVDLELVNRSEVNDLFKFTIVRNPFSLVVSDYYHLLGGLCPPCFASFRTLLKREGRWKDLLTNQMVSSYRGDHLRKQTSYLSLDGTANALDHVGKVEEIDYTFDLLERITGERFDRTLRLNVARKHFKHYSHFYSNHEFLTVTEFFAEDITRFGYDFDDRRSFRTRFFRPCKRAVAQARISKLWVGQLARLWRRH